MTFAEFKNKHAHENILVCGLGESINQLDDMPRCVTIGCNDIGRKFTPTYLLNVNNKNQYKGDRFSYIENSRAEALFTHQPEQQGAAKIPIVKLTLDPRVGAVDMIDDRIPHYRTTPYMGVSIAAHMGARHIGLIGVDLCENHFWIKDGPHRLIRELDAIDKQFDKLAEHLRTKGVDLWNLSPISKLSRLPRKTLTEFLSDKRNLLNTSRFMPMTETMS